MPLCKTGYSPEELREIHLNLGCTDPKTRLTLVTCQDALKLLIYVQNISYVYLIILLLGCIISQSTPLSFDLDYSTFSVS